MSKKQTAVEWLINQIDVQYPNIDIKWKESIIEQAKELEKQNLIDFANYALDKALDLDVRTAYSQTEQYYKNTFIQSVKTEK